MFGSTRIEGMPGELSEGDSYRGVKWKKNTIHHFLENLGSTIFKANVAGFKGN